MKKAKCCKSEILKSKFGYLIPKECFDKSLVKYDVIDQISIKENSTVYRIHDVTLVTEFIPHPKFGESHGKFINTIHLSLPAEALIDFGRNKYVLVIAVSKVSGVYDICGFEQGFTVKRAVSYSCENFNTCIHTESRKLPYVRFIKDDYNIEDELRSLNVAVKDI